MILMVEMAEFLNETMDYGSQCDSLIFVYDLPITPGLIFELIL